MITYGIYSLLYKLCFSPYLHGCIFSTAVVCSQQVWKDTTYFCFYFCVMGASRDPLNISQKSQRMFWMYIQTENATGKDAYLYTLHTRCSCQSLEALCKGSNFEMVSTYPLTLYFLNFKFWKKNRVQHICSESQLHSMCNIHTVKGRFKHYWREYLFLCFYMIANVRRRACPKLGSDRHFLANLSVTCWRKADAVKSTADTNRK